MSGMDHGEQFFKTDFIKSTVEKTPFLTNPTQKFFVKWCEINDSIVPEFISRDEWDQRGVLGILEKNNQDKQTLFLPPDLHLWEMMDVIKTVDHDTFAKNPEKRDQRADKIKELGKTFEKAGLYFAEYLPEFKNNEDGSQQIIKNLAIEFYQYGLSLQHKKRRIDQLPEESKLSQEDKTKLDEWFLGKDIYQKRLARLGEKATEDQKEEIRKKCLSVYFKALAKEGYKADGEKAWEKKVGPFQHLQDKTREQITKAIETPKREMQTAIYRRGVEKLVTEIKSNLFFTENRLYDVLAIDKLKQELEAVRKTNDLVLISNKELEIAKKIGKEVRRFAYGASANNPSDMIKTRVINCVGSSVLGGALLDKVGIKYLGVSILKHSSTVLITSDKRVYWQDFTPGNLLQNYHEITPYLLENGLSIVDLQQISDSGISFTFKEFNPYSFIPGQLRIGLFKPEIALQSQILNNTGNALKNLGRNEEAVEAYKQAICVNPNYSFPYNGLGNALINLGRNEEAVEAYKQAINIDPVYADIYNGLGNALKNLGRNEEAIEAYKQAISIDSTYFYSYNGLGNALYALGRNEEAVEAYKQAISINPKYFNPHYGMGNALHSLGRNEEAVEVYKQAISIDSQDAVSYFGLGNVLYDIGRKDEAKKTFVKFIELWKGDLLWVNAAKEMIDEIG